MSDDTLAPLDPGGPWGSGSPTALTEAQRRARAERAQQRARERERAWAAAQRAGVPPARRISGPRDPARIDRILAALRVYWTQHPDLRLAQIVGNAHGKPGDPYRMEDEVIEAHVTAGFRAAPGGVE